MRRLLVAAAVLCASVARASAGDAIGPVMDDLGPPIDRQQTHADAAFVDLLEPVRFLRSGGNDRRPYIAGIVGNSFATLGTPLGPTGDSSGDPSPSPAANESLFTAGGAIGLAFEALDRDWRVEFEGRGRNNLVSNRTSTFDAVVGPDTYLSTTTAKKRLVDDGQPVAGLRTHREVDHVRRRRHRGWRIPVLVPEVRAGIQLSDRDGPVCERVCMAGGWRHSLCDHRPHHPRHRVPLLFRSPMALRRQ